jgi:ELWxxDGT repeat protein
MKQIYLCMLMLLSALITSYGQPILVSKIPAGSTNFTSVGSFLYFTSSDSLLRSDGTAAGTILIKSGLKNPGNLREFNGLLYFTADPHPTEYWRSPRELYRSNGTPAGTILLKKSSDYNLQVTGQAGTLLYFTASDPSTGIELFRTDGTTGGTFLLKDINPGTGNGFGGSTAARGNELFFTATNSTTGTELWKTNGTTAGTTIVKDINPGSASAIDPFNAPLKEMNGLVYFEATDGISGHQLYKTDGTAGNTAIVKDLSISGEDGDVHIYYAQDGILYFGYFSAATGGVLHLFKTNGTETGTTIVQSLGDYYDENNGVYRFLKFNNKTYFFFSRNNFTQSFWVTNGTSEGTALLKDNVTIDGFVDFAEIVNNQIVFFANSQGFYSRIYKSDGTSDGTVVYEEFNYPYGTPQAVALDNYFFYQDFAHPEFSGGEPNEADDIDQLFQSDGNTKQLVRSLYGISLSGTSNITRAGDKIWFKTHNRYSDIGAETIPKLWIYQPGTPAPAQVAFQLINAATDQVVKTIGQYENIPFDATADQISIAAVPTVPAGSVIFRLDGKIIRSENTAPYAVAGDNNGNFNSWDITPGGHMLTATAYSGTSGTGSIVQESSVAFNLIAPSEIPAQITFTLVNAQSDADIFELSDGQTIDLAFAGTNKLNIRANSTFPDTKSVVFDYNGTNGFRTENTAPYALFGDNNGDYAVRYLSPGSYTLKATPYSGLNGTGNAGIPLQITFTITNGTFATSGVKTSPNPVGNRMTIETDFQSEHADILIYDFSGREFYKNTYLLSDGKFDIDLTESGLQAGIYFVKISGAEETKVVSIIKD